MSERKWSEINVYFNDGSSVQIHRSDFNKLEEIRPVLEALEHVKHMQKNVNRLLGEVGE